MFRLFESIRLENGKFHHLEMHRQRISRSSSAVFGNDRAQHIIESLEEVARPTEGLYKARLQYDENSETLSYIPYIMRAVSSLKLVIDNQISYVHKYTDRTKLEELFSQRQQCDDIIIVKDGWITDSSYSNVLFKRGNSWITPTHCLLKGTMRELLLQEGIIIEEEIRETDIFRFEKVKLINAMIGMKGPEIEIDRVIR